MVRFRIGVSILAGVLALGFCLQTRMEQIQQPIAQLIDEAGTLAQQGSWEQAEQFAARAETLWREHRTFTAAMADHQPLEDIESLMAQLKSYAGDSEFSALCAEIARRVRAVAEANRLSLGTVF